LQNSLLNSKCWNCASRAICGTSQYVLLLGFVLCLSARGVTNDCTKCSFCLNTRGAVPVREHKAGAGSARACPAGRTQIRLNQNTTKHYRNTTETLPFRVSFHRLYLLQGDVQRKNSHSEYTFNVL